MDWPGDNIDHKNIVDWFVIESLGFLPKSEFEEIIARKTEPGPHNVQLFINGVEVPVKKTFELFKSCYDDMLKEVAKELISEKFSETISLLHDLEQKVKSQIPDEGEWT